MKDKSYKSHRPIGNRLPFTFYLLPFTFYLLPFTFYLTSCRVSKHVPENSFLLNKTKLHIDNSNINPDDLDLVIKQHPNRKVLGLVRFHLSVYNFANTGKETKFKRWLKNTVGEEPVILDTLMTKKSSQQLNLLLKNKGYFNNIVRDTTLLGKRKKADVHYFVNTGLPYTIRKITFSIDDTALIQPVRAANKRTLLAPGNNFDVDLLQIERERMSSEMKNRGYFYFSKEYIYFKIDSAFNNNKIDIEEIIKNPLLKDTIDNKDTLVETRHKIYFIRNVYINSDYLPHELSQQVPDTLISNGYYFLNAKKSQFREQLLLKAIFIKPGQIYNAEDVDFTQGRIAALKTFKFINIRFDEATPSDGKNYLDCFILLTPSAKQSVTLLTEGTHRGGNLGIGGSLIYNNKNTFKGAEVLELRFKGGLEIQKLLASTDRQILADNAGDVKKYVPFNTLQIAPEATLFIPNFPLPRRTIEWLKIYSPKTNITVLYDFQKRPDFNRQIFNASFGCSWKNAKYNSYIFAPVDINFVKIEKSGDFFKKLEELKNPFLTQSFNDHVILASRYSFFYTNQTEKHFSNYMYFRVNIENSGSAQRLLNKWLGSPLDSGTNSYRIFGVRYAHYIKTDFDMRFYNRVNKHSKLVYRGYFGIGVPLENFKALPFEKSYYGGGANGMRAWTVRSLGPGSLIDSNYSAIDKLGDLQLEANAEYRFDIIRFIKGAAFIDVGNIWLLKADTGRNVREGGNIDVNRFYKEIAVDAGLGARLDFDFIIVRIDAALQIKDPSLIEGERWIFQPKDKTNEFYESYEKGKRYSVFDKVNFNLGIGYPF